MNTELYVVRTLNVSFLFPFLFDAFLWSIADLMRRRTKSGPESLIVNTLSLEGQVLCLGFLFSPPLPLETKTVNISLQQLHYSWHRIPFRQERGSVFSTSCPVNNARIVLSLLKDMSDCPGDDGCKRHSISRANWDWECQTKRRFLLVISRIESAIVVEEPEQ